MNSGPPNTNAPWWSQPAVARPQIVAATAATGADAQEVALKLALPAGRTTLQGWFRDAAGADLCGAFFVTVKRKE